MSAIIAAYDDHNKNWKTVLDEKKKERYLLFYLVTFNKCFSREKTYQTKQSFSIPPSKV